MRRPLPYNERSVGPHTGTICRTTPAFMAAMTTSAFALLVLLIAAGAAVDGLTELSGPNTDSADNLQACIGECDKDSQCAAGLMCFQRGYDAVASNVPGCRGLGTNPSWDYCYTPQGTSARIALEAVHGPRLPRCLVLGALRRAVATTARRAADRVRADASARAPPPPSQGATLRRRSAGTASARKAGTSTGTLSSVACQAVRPSDSP